MAKRARKRRSSKKQGRATNWYVIGGVVGVSVIILLAMLLASTLSGDEDSLLANYCASNPDNCVSRGNDESSVTVVEVSDYGCGHCAAFNLQKAGPLDEMYVETGQVNWVIMPYALRNQAGQYPTMPSAVSAMCANEQGRFFDYHLAMFQLQGGPLFNTEEGFIQTASSLGMDTEEFSSCLSNNDYVETVLRNIDMAQRAGIRSTPTFYIGNRLVSGNLPSVSDYQQLIDRELSSVE